MERETDRQRQRDRERQASLCNPGGSRTHCTAQAGFKLIATLLLQSPSVENTGVSHHPQLNFRILKEITLNLENGDDDGVTICVFQILLLSSLYVGLERRLSPQPEKQLFILVVPATIN